MPASLPRVTASPRPVRRTPLAACVVPLFAFASATELAHAANVWTVDSCDEASSGDSNARTGTLRFAAAHAASGDTIDASGLACSTISLTTGAITFNQDDITLVGPDASTLTISGKQNIAAALITHNGYGTLTLKHLDLYYTNNTRVAGYVHGGCVYSYANIELDHVRATHCNATTGAGNVAGGGVFAHSDMTMKFSTITFNQAHGTTGARAGGAYAKHHLRIEYSTIDHNTVYSSYASFGGAGGGVFAKGLMLRNSTVSNNHSHGDGGGIAVVESAYGGDYLKMYSSTLSGNSADHWMGGGYVSAPVVAVYNSTIAFNSAAAGNRFIAPGLVLSTVFGPVTATLQNSIFSNNSTATVVPVDNYGITEYDLGTVLVGPVGQQTPVTFNAAPANNLIRSTFAAGLPADTLHGSSCPLLGPLRDNGGPTPTHALLSGSAAIDAGNNMLALAQDQRGVEGDPGPPYAFARESNGVADIGAYEVQQGDRIFATSGEGCVLQPPGT